MVNNTIKCKRDKIKVKMLLDTKGEKGGGLFSGQVHSLNCKYGKDLIKKGKAKEYNEMEDARRIVNLNGKEMSWSAYLKGKN